MGFISDTIDSFTGQGGVDAAGDAASMQADQYARALRLARKQNNRTQRNFDPFINAGQGAIGFMEKRLTPQGLDKQLGKIMRTDVFDNLLDERTQSVEGMLGSGGLMRSGTAMNEAAKIPTDLAFQINQILTGNAQSLIANGQNAAAGAGSIGGQFANNAGSLIGQQGNAMASGPLGEAQARSGGVNNMISAGMLAALFAGGGGGAAAGAAAPAAYTGGGSAFDPFNNFGGDR